MMKDTSYELFLEPGVEFRGKPFWSWNGTLDKEELLRQIHVFKEMGFGGFFMHSRTGLRTEYLGEEWFECINACAEEAERLGMEAWLYDEDRWPSGTAGGLVTEEPRYRSKYIRLETIPAELFEWKKEVFTAFLCKLDGLSYTDCRRLFREERSEALRGGTVLVFSIVEQWKESFYNGFTYLDTLNREAVERFLQITHEQYKARSGGHFGKAIKGVFTDEPHRGSLMDGFGIHNEQGHWHAPWTYLLFDRFQEKYGYDLVPRLPELFLQPDGRKVSQVKWHYVELLQEMFQDNFFKPVNEWCEQNRLILTGHTLHEDSLSAQTAMVGSVMRYYEHMGYPGVDVLTEGNLNYWIVKQLASAARQTGKPWMLSELYGCTGWQMPLEGHKAVGDWQALFGINIRCHHLSWYTMEGEAKRDYPASISHQSAWWKEYRYVETYFSRLGVVLSQGSPRCELLVVSPVESVWCQIHPGWSRGLSAKSPEIQEIERLYRHTFGLLAGAQLDFDYGDEEMMSRLGSIGRDEAGRTVLKVGQAAYTAVVVSGMTTIRSTTIDLLERFMNEGGTVIVAGEAPPYVDAIPWDSAARLADGAVSVPQQDEDLVNACRSAVAVPVQAVDSATGDPIRDIFAQCRSDGSSDYFVLMNMNRKEGYRGVRIRLEAEGVVEEWSCSTGERFEIAAASVDGGLEFITDFPPVGERVYVARNRPAGSLPVAGHFETTASVPMEGPFAYRLDEPNVCVLDRASIRLGGGEWEEEREILKADRAIRDRLGVSRRSGQMIQPWYAKKFSESKLEKTALLELSFRFFVKELPEEPFMVAIERPDQFTISLNGQLVVKSPAATDKWVDACFVLLPIERGILRLGENRIVLETEFRESVDLEAIYLLGKFGVELDGVRRVITRLPDKLHTTCITGQGLPFYGGKLTYIVEPEQAADAVSRLPAVPGVRKTLSFPHFEAACIKVRTPDQETVLAWRPYETVLQSSEEQGLEIEVFLTRRNTFGPLHQLPAVVPFYGPDNFVSEGESFSEEVVLLPSSLTGPPVLSVQELRS